MLYFWESLSLQTLFSAQAEKAETEFVSSFPTIAILQKLCIVKNVMSYNPDYKSKEPILEGRKGAGACTKMPTLGSKWVSRSCAIPLGCIMGILIFSFQKCYSHFSLIFNVQGLMILTFIVLVLEPVNEITIFYDPCSAA